MTPTASELAQVLGGVTTKDLIILMCAGAAIFAALIAIVLYLIKLHMRPLEQMQECLVKLTDTTQSIQVELSEIKGSLWSREQVKDVCASVVHEHESNYHMKG